MDFFQNAKFRIYIEQSGLNSNLKRNLIPNFKLNKKLLKNRQKYNYIELPKNLRQQREKLFFRVIINICRSANLNLNTFCLALEIYDIINLKYKVDYDILPKFGLMALVLASKVHQSKNECLYPLHLKDFFKEDDLSLAIKIEMDILLIFDFNLNLKNRLDFLKELILDPNYFHILPKNPNPKSLKMFEKFARKLLFLTYYEFDFLQFNELKIACTVILLCRKSMKIPISWPVDLMERTGFSRIDLEPCSVLLRDCYSNYKEKHYND